MRVEIWTDIVCPFCYIGKHSFNEFLKDLPEGETIEVINRSFELDPTASKTESVNAVKSLADKYGFSLEDAKERMKGVQTMAERNGLAMDIFETKGANTRDLHRIIHYARESGRDEALMNAFFKAHFVDGKDLNDRETKMDISASAGLNEKEVADILDSGAFNNEVLEDIRKAQETGVRGVPYFLFDGKYEASGAQPKEAFMRIYETAKNGKIR